MSAIWDFIVMVWNAIFGGGGGKAEWRGCMFVPASFGMPNNQGVSSQLDYRGCHGKSNDNAMRIDMLQCVKNWGGNTLVYIRGEFKRPNEVLDMCLNGRKSPTDGHYFPVNIPTSGNGEVDWAMWAKEKYGIDRHVCFIWNDNNSVPFTEGIVAEAVKSYDGCRLGTKNIMFGTCLETDEPQVMPNVNTVLAVLGWIAKYAPLSPMVVGSCSEDFLIAVGSKNSKVLLWFEQSARGSPVTDPLTRATFPAFLATCERLAAKFGYDRVIPGEWWAANPGDVKWMTDQLIAAGFTVLGSGKYI
jgi:hypothetical protein